MDSLSDTQNPSPISPRLIIRFQIKPQLRINRTKVVNFEVVICALSAFRITKYWTAARKADNLTAIFEQIV
jgi:hypothetical protein